ncbi:hypothetical protein B566_EDAN007518 [Ephemera danica]|nr:hypothetical protein B566_EDAN007518 [Ephemera danica]
MGWPSHLGDWSNSPILVCGFSMINGEILVSSDVSSGEEEDGDDEDDEVQALIVSDAPLCSLPGRTPHVRADQRPAVPQSSVPQFNPVPRSSSHSELLIANSMSFSSFSSASSNKIPINMALYTSSSSYLAHLPGNPKSPSNPAYYSVETGPGFTAISYASVPTLTSTNKPRDEASISRNSELRSSLSSMVPPPKVHQASITSCNKLLPAGQAKKPASVSSSVNTVPQTAHNVSRTYVSTDPALRNEGPPMSPSPRNDAQMSRKDGPASMNPSMRTEGPVYISRNESIANTSLGNDGPVTMSPSMRNEGPVHTSRSEGIANTSLRKDGAASMSPSLRYDGSAHMSPSPRNDVQMSRKDGPVTMSPSLRTEGPVYISRNESIANTSLRNEGPVAMSPSMRNEGPVHTSRNEGAKCKSTPPLTLKPLNDSRNENGLPLLSLNSSPLYLSPFPPSNQRENNSNPPLFKISSVDLRSRPLPDIATKDVRPPFDSQTPQLIAMKDIPSMVAWHPDGSLVVVANEKGQLQSFDLALAPVRIQLLSEEPVPAHPQFHGIQQEARAGGVQ